MSVCPRACVLCLGLSVALGCSGSDRVPQSVTPDGDAGFWAAGSKGYAAYVDRGGHVERRDYPLDRKADRWAYERWSGTAAQVVMVEQQAVLVTRIGEFYDWIQGAWRRLPVPTVEYYGSSPQLDHVFKTSEGRMGVYFHNGAFLLGTMGELLARRHQQDSMEQYMSWIGTAGSTIYGLGWDKQGNTRALYRREPSGQWVASTRLLWEPLCVIHQATDRPLVVTERALVDPSPGSQGDLSGPLPRVGSDTTVSQMAELGYGYVSRCISDGDRNALLLTSLLDGVADIVTLREGQVSLWDCSGWPSWETIDAMLYRGQWTLVTESLELVVVPKQCEPVDAGATQVDASTTMVEAR